MNSIFFLYSGIRELSEEIQELKEEIKDLKKEIKDLKSFVMDSEKEKEINNSKLIKEIDKTFEVLS
jgi:uncharacterized coiled-coil DUF342 family protein